MTDNQPKTVNNFDHMEVPSRPKRHKDLGVREFYKGHKYGPYMNKSNKIYILVQELDHLLPLSYFDNFLYFKSVLIISCFTLPHLLSH